jgi:hypothetical protein
MGKPGLADASRCPTLPTEQGKMAFIEEAVGVRRCRSAAYRQGRWSRSGEFTRKRADALGWDARLCCCLFRRER